MDVNQDSAAERSNRQTSLRLTLALATIQGVALWYLTTALIDTRWPAEHSALYSALLALAAFLVPCIYALAEWSQARRMWAAVAGIAVLLAIVGFHHGAMLSHVGEQGFRSEEALFVHFLAAFMLVFHALPFIQCTLEAPGQWRNYARLFSYAWRNALRLVLAALFTGLSWLLLWVCAELFQMIGIDFFQVIFFKDKRVTWLVSSLAFGTGVFLAENSDRLLSALRAQVLSVLKWLVVLSALILTLFSLALLVKSPELFAAQKRVISAVWLLWLAALNIYLYNAAYQDGSEAQPFPPLLSRLLRHATPLIAIIALMAAYALIVRINAYGLTVARVWGLLVGLMVLIYSLGYVWAARPSTPWMGRIATVNVSAALVLCGTLFLMLTPILSPYRLAAGSMAQRLVTAEGSVDGDRLRSLRRSTGDYGLRILRRYADPHTPAVNAALRTAAIEALKSDEWSPAVARPPESLQIEIFPTGALIEPELRVAIEAASPVRIGGWCSSTASCAVLRVDWDADGRDDALLLAGESAYLFMQNAALGWGTGRYISRNCPAQDCSFNVTLASLRAADHELQRRQVSDVRIGAQRFYFDHMRQLELGYQ